MKQGILASAVLFLGTLLAGCGGGYGYTSAYVAYGPPPPRAYGVIGVAPGPGYVWRDGYYAYRGGNYAWVGGAWVRPPHPRATWERGEWRHEGRGWRYHEGHWR